MDLLSVSKNVGKVKIPLALPSSFYTRIRVALPRGHRFFPDCLRENYALWIQWAIKVIPSEDVWFVSMTFKKAESYFMASQLCSKWLWRLRQSYDFKIRGLRLRWILALALQKRGVIHFHLLICAEGLGLLSRKRWEHRWQAASRNTGTCRIYDANTESPRYLASEISKEGELFWGGDWRGLNTPGAVRCSDSHAEHAEAIISRLMSFKR